MEGLWLIVFGGLLLSSTAYAPSCFFTVVGFAIIILGLMVTLGVGVTVAP
jgi:hypothetical protein